MEHFNIQGHGSRRTTFHSGPISEDWFMFVCLYSACLSFCVDDWIKPQCFFASSHFIFINSCVCVVSVLSASLWFLQFILFLSRSVTGYFLLSHLFRHIFLRKHWKRMHKHFPPTVSVSRKSSSFSGMKIRGTKIFCWWFSWFQTLKTLLSQ